MPSELYYVPSSGTKVTESVYRSRTWSRTPNFKNLAKRDLPINPYDDYRSKSEQTSYGGDYTVTPSGTSYATPVGPRLATSTFHSFLYGEGRDAQVSVLTPARLAQERSLLVLNLLGKISDTKVNVAVSLKEASKTSSMILGRANKLYLAYRHFRKGRFRKAADELNIPIPKVHNNWLEYKYGWMPLLMEVKGAAEFFAQQNLGRPTRFSVSSKTEIPFSKSKFFPNGHNPVGPVFVDVSQTVKGKTTFRLKATVELTNPHLASLQQVGLTNPALVIWEVVPFSFVFDWFVSVGDWLTGLTALHGVTVVKVMDSTSTEIDVRRSYPKKTQVSGTTTYVCSGETFGGTIRAYIRASGSLSVPWLPPVNNNPLGFQKMVTSLALLRSTSKREFRV